MVIKHNGQTVDTKFHMDITDEKFNELRQAYYKKPDLVDVQSEMIKIHNGGVKNTNITNYFYKHLMAKVKLHHSKWSISEVFESKELIGSFLAKTLKNDKVYPPNQSEIKNIQTAFRLGGKGIAAKPSNFPLKSAQQVLEKYNVNDNYYDFSCGWGVRILASLSKGLNYFGTDPNNLLIDELKKFAWAYKKTNYIEHITTDIRCQGSEVFVPEWENTIGVAFSSPPYFGLEDYRVGEGQSFKEGITYETWKTGYLNGTMANIYKYLVEDGTLIININDYGNFPLVKDTIEACTNNGFELADTFVLKNIQRISSKKQLNDNSEDCMVFRKVII